MKPEIRPLIGPDLVPYLEDVAHLRIKVFREYPYLYDGDMEYEQRYLSSYVTSPGAIVVGAFDGDRLVGAATGTPMEDHAAEFGAPFVERGFDLEKIFYCAESILLRKYRGKGLGHKFFDAREEHARALGRTGSAFCAVVRPEHDPARPKKYHDLEAFWQKRGYEKMPGVIAKFAWPDLGHKEETEKELQFWYRDL